MREEGARHPATSFLPAFLLHSLHISLPPTQTGGRLRQELPTVGRQQRRHEIENRKHLSNRFLRSSSVGKVAFHLNE